MVIKMKRFRKIATEPRANGAEQFPPPLTPKEEETAFAMLATDYYGARETLIIHNLRLVAHIAKKFKSVGADIEDLTSIGVIGLIKAVGAFNPDKNVKLATYASRCIENEILMFLRKSNEYKHEISIDEPLNRDREGNELFLSDVLGAENDTVNADMENDAERNSLLSAIDRLPLRERRIMEIRFGLNGEKERTQKEAAEIMGISQSYISRLEKRIVEKLRKELE
ncbi:MAG: RNA polymerase sporulation sigma factor SigK [Oscillospiraceae bacterium]|jgi:RNA polymerase sporulation-specific sigma factor|nr:RNA polymerase sporulation sigma factor SigK [Oscillospiraceae bacterium]